MTPNRLPATPAVSRLATNDEAGVGELATPPAGARECDCPAYVLRCSHFGAARLMLSDAHASDSCEECKGVNFAVWSVTGAPHPCSGCTRPVELVGRWDIDQLLKHFGAYPNDEAAALAAFYDAEMRLLRGDLS